jgi:hypothetical protein
MGFRPYGKRDFICCHGDILHIIALQLSAWGSKDFAVNYGAMPLFPPTEIVYLPTGGRLRQGKSPDGWWSSLTHEKADASMASVVQAVEDQLPPFFRRTSTYAGLADELGLVDKAPYTFMKACCEVTIGHRDARITLEQAISLFQQFLDEHPDAAWAIKGLAEAAALVSAIDNGSEQRLLDEWAQATATALKIQRGEAAA